MTDQTVWASGSGGAVGRTIDGGKTWSWITVPGYEKRDFRDIEAFDDQTALIIAVAEPAIILKTSDGGKSWRIVFSDSTKGMFLDAIDFANEKQGTVIGDPVNGSIFMAGTIDGGEHWTVWPAGKRPIPADGEAFFAASGTNLIDLGKQTDEPFSLLMVSGGKKSNLWSIGKKMKKDSLPLVQGLESTGANSIAFNGITDGVIVGGNFSKDTISQNNCVLFRLSDPLTFSFPKTNPHGYRSCVTYLTDKKIIACGTSGVDISMDSGQHWTLISTQGFHVCQRAKKGTAVFLAGGHGRVAVLVE